MLSNFSDFLKHHNNHEKSVYLRKIETAREGHKHQDTVEVL